MFTCDIVFHDMPLFAIFHVTENIENIYNLICREAMVVLCDLILNIVF